MKTYRSVINEGFKATGLSPDQIARNSGLLIECINAKPGVYGLEGYLPDIYDMAATISSIDSAHRTALGNLGFVPERDWPFPQIFLTDVGVHVGAKEGLFYVTSTTVYSYSTGAVTWPWFCAEINQKPCFVSGDVIVYYNDISEAYVVKKYA